MCQVNLISFFVSVSSQEKKVSHRIFASVRLREKKMFPLSLTMQR